MKCGYSKILYNQRNKDETIASVIKRLFGEHITFRLIRMQNREMNDMYSIQCLQNGEVGCYGDSFYTVDN